MSKSVKTTVVQEGGDILGANASARPGTKGVVPSPSGKPPMHPMADTSERDNVSGRTRDYVPGYSSGGSTPSIADGMDGSEHQIMSDSAHSRTLKHSSSVLGIDKMIEDRKNNGSLADRIVHMEVPFGKPIEEVYDGVHDGPVLGSGISGLVRLCVHKKTKGKYAVKCLDLGLVESEEGLQQLREEIAIMCQLDHPNIVRLEEVYESKDEIYLVQELCVGGELFDRLDEQPDYHYTESQCAKLVKQMLCSVRYIHSKGIIHRDLKLENFLFSTNEPNSELKMIDFGLSKHFKYGEVQHEAVGTPYTVAPEVIHGSYDERCDVWAIGVITYLLLSGDPPFGGCGGPESLMEVRSNILAGRFRFEPEEIWENVSRDAKDFIRKLLVTDPTRRPTARQCQQEKWLQEWANKDKKQGDNLLNKEVVKALVNFKEYSDMRKLLCEVLSFTLLPDQITDLRKEFEKLDIDGSGEISLKGLKQVLMRGAGAGSLGALTEEEVEDIFNAMRVRKTETRIHWHEFIAAGLSQCKVDERNLRLAFDRLDADHKGYITFDNLMDMMGRDDAESEDELRAMWASSMKACKCHDSSQITYEDFLLLMKGQTLQHKEPSPRPSLPINPPLPASLPKLQASILNTGGSLDVLHELSDSNETEDDTEPESKHATTKGVQAAAPFGFAVSHSYTDEPISIDDDENFDERLSEAADKQIQMQMSGNFTPPQSPVRSPKDFVTPTTGERFNIMPDLKLLGHSMPELPDSRDFSRRRSKSVDDQDYLSPPRDDHEQEHPAVIPDIRRAMLLPEHGSGKHIDPNVHDDKLTPLVVNRKLYRAHRQMRLAVLEASKRFEEEQLRRAKAELQQAQQPDGRHFGAGLVMKRGKKKEVSSDAIRKLMSERQSRQKTMVDIAARKGGRGKRARKKTVSDMSAMLSAIPTGDINVPTPIKDGNSSEDETELTLHDITEPEPTVLGVFRKTKDPFQQMGKQVAQVLGKSFVTSSHSNLGDSNGKRSSMDSGSQTDSSSIKLSVSDGELNALTSDPQTP